MTGIEIKVISGARHNERLVFEADRVVIGGGPHCDLYFDRHADPGADGTELVLQREGEVWQVRKVSGEQVMVDQDLLEGTRAVHSGDVIRLSLSGPEFFVYIRDASGNVSASESAGSLQASPMTTFSGPGMRSMPAGSTQSQDQAKEASQERKSNMPPAKSSGLALAATLGIGAVLLIAAAATIGTMFNLGLKPGIPGTAATRSVVPAVLADPPSQVPPAPASQSPSIVVDESRRETGAAAPQTERGRSSTPTQFAASRPIVMLAAVNPQPAGQPQLEPFATACAVDVNGHQLLLTTARVVADMARLGFTYYAIGFSRNGDSLDTAEIDKECFLLHRHYADTLRLQDTDSGRFFNLGLLRCHQVFARAWKLAAPADLRDLKPGTLLSCWSAFRPWQPMALQASQAIPSGLSSPRSHAVTLDRKIPLGNRTGFCDLLELVLPADCLEGSPIVDSQGKVLGVCLGEISASTKSDMHGTANAATISHSAVSMLWDPHAPTEWVRLTAQSAAAGSVANHAGDANERASPSPDHSRD